MTKMDWSETDLVGKDMRFHTENAGILLTARFCEVYYDIYSYCPGSAFLFRCT